MKGSEPPAVVQSHTGGLGSDGSCGWSPTSDLEGLSAPSTQDSHLHTLRRETHFLTRQTTAHWNKPLGKNDLETTQNGPTILFTQRLNFCPQTPRGPVSMKRTTQVHVHVQPRHLFTVWPPWPDELSLHDWEVEQ